MDLKESKLYDAKRHPWEIARARTVARLLRPMLRDEMSILDVGCGDGYLGRELFKRVTGGAMTGVDINLTEEGIRALEQNGPGITYRATLPESDNNFDLLLLLDVLEHVEDDCSLLADLARHHVKVGGRVLITVPAFQQLYSDHDRFLGHHRRYRLSRLEEVVEAAGLTGITSGYFFSSLLLPKFLLFGLLHLCKGESGVARWQGGEAFTAVLATFLYLENAFLIAAAKRGLKVPGLSAWALCEKDSPARK